MNIIAGIQWDEGNRDKCRKHGVSTAEIEALLVPGMKVAPDIAHSGAEDRFIAVGCNESGRPLLVAFTIRERAGQRYLRPISARYMHAKEIERYEKTSS